MASYKFGDLEKKHKGFITPQFSIKVGGSEVNTEDFPIIDLNVSMSAAYDIGSCEFVIAGIFNQEKGKFEKDIYSNFKPGKIVDVKIGYSSTATEGVFKGYINALSYEFNGKSGPYIVVQCLDAKGALVNNITWTNYGKLDIKDIVAKILREKCSSYATISTVSSDFDEGESGVYDEISETREFLDDYNYIIQCAKKTNNSFCVLYDKLYFCENLAKNAKEVVELSWGKSLLSFTSEIDLSGQIGSVEVFGTDPINQKTFSAEASKVSGSGESGADMASVVKKKKVVITDPEVVNQNQAANLAQDKLESYAAQLVKCKGSTIGIPEIKAGEKLKITGMGAGADGVYYLNHVNHRINGQGYITSFDGGSSTVIKFI